MVVVKRRHHVARDSRIAQRGRHRSRQPDAVQGGMDPQRDLPHRQIDVESSLFRDRPLLGGRTQPNDPRRTFTRLVKKVAV